MYSVRCPSATGQSLFSRHIIVSSMRDNGRSIFRLYNYSIRSRHALAVVFWVGGRSVLVVTAVLVVVVVVAVDFVVDNCTHTDCRRCLELVLFVEPLAAVLVAFVEASAFVRGNANNQDIPEIKK